MAALGRRIAVVTAVVALTVGLSVPASATEMLIYGAGWGHGVGLSQYGAKAMAADGASYGQIVGRYFSGATTARYPSLHPETFLARDETPLWVGLHQQSENLSFTIEEGTATLCFDATSHCVATAHSGQTWRFTRDGTGKCVFSQIMPSGRVELVGQPWGCSASVRPETPSTTLRVPLKARSYRNGTLRFRQAPSTGLIQTVLEIGVEDYVRGLSEVPESWPAAAIKAQVVVSRSQAVWYALDRGPADQFDIEAKDDCYCNLRDGTPDQVFRGYTGLISHPRWVDAVEATFMQVINVRGNTGLGLYSSSSGGLTESFYDVFGNGDHPYLTVVDDHAAFSEQAANPHSSWSAKYSQAVLANAFGFSWLVDAEVTERNASGTARTVRLAGIVAGRPTEITVSGIEFRRALSLRSTAFDISVVAQFEDVPAEYQFSGEILGLYESGVTTGCTATSFCPGRAVTRAEMAVFLVRALDLVPATSPAPFTDNDGHLFEAEIETLWSHGVTTGCTATSFCPGRAVTRAEMAAFLVRALDLVPVTTR